MVNVVLTLERNEFKVNTQLVVGRSLVSVSGSELPVGSQKVVGERDSK